MATTSFTKQFKIEIKSEDWGKFVGNYVDSGKALTIIPKSFSEIDEQNKRGIELIKKRLQKNNK